MFSSYLDLTSALDRAEWLASCSGRVLHQGKDPGTLCLQSNDHRFKNSAHTANINFFRRIYSFLHKGA